MEIKPSDPRYLMEDFERAGGLQAVMKSMEVPPGYECDYRERRIPRRESQESGDQGPGDHSSAFQSKDPRMEALPS